MVKNPPANEGDARDALDTWIGKIPWPWTKHLLSKSRDLEFPPLPISSTEGRTAEQSALGNMEMEEKILT